MKTIYKYALNVLDQQDITLPSEAQILSIQFQRGQLCLWALVDPSKPTEFRHFQIYGTGHPVKEPEFSTLKFITTIQDGSLVWHIFEVV